MTVKWCKSEGEIHSLWNDTAVICDPWRRQHKYVGVTLYCKDSMVYSPRRLLNKLSEDDCAALAVGYAINDQSSLAEKSFFSKSISK